MKKLAIFVEGKTEQIFSERLLIEVIGQNNITVSKTKRFEKNLLTIIEAKSINPKKEYYVLIRDCGGDSSVKSDIIEHCEKLSESGYDRIIGLRDVYPFTHAEIPALKMGLSTRVPTKYIPIKIVLAIMEVEAWFLGEVSHYRKIHPSLTESLVSTGVDFDPFRDNPESRSHPSIDLDDIYKIVGLRYTKTENSIKRTIKALDYSELYLSVKSKINSLNEFITEVDSFVSR
ncbi:MAG: DUF4276 family protein [Candidatus Kerfeldbacteria bacterium]